MHQYPEKYVSDMEEQLQTGKYEQAIKSYFRFMLRSYQDLALVKDKSCSEATETVKMMKLKPILQQYESHIEKFLNKKFYLELAKEIKNETEEDKLEDPRWIYRYGLEKFLDILGQSGNQEKFIDQEKWKEERLRVIVNTIKQLEK